MTADGLCRAPSWYEALRDLVVLVNESAVEFFAAKKNVSRDKKHHADAEKNESVVRPRVSDYAELWVIFRDHIRNIVSDEVNRDKWVEYTVLYSSLSTLNIFAVTFCRKMYEEPHKYRYVTVA